MKQRTSAPLSAQQSSKGTMIMPDVVVHLPRTSSCRMMPANWWMIGQGSAEPTL